MQIWISQLASIIEDIGIGRFIHKLYVIKADFNVKELERALRKNLSNENFEQQTRQIVKIRMTRNNALNLKKESGKSYNFR